MAGEGDARVDLRAVLETHAVSISYDRPRGRDSMSKVGGGIHTVGGVISEYQFWGA